MSVYSFKSTKLKTIKLLSILANPNKINQN